MEKNISKITKVVVLIIFIIIMAVLTQKLIPIFKEISTEQGRVNLKTEIESLGVEGIIIIIGLMIVQIFLPILPGEPVEVLARYVLWTNWWFACDISWCVLKFFNNILRC